MMPTGTLIVYDRNTLKKVLAARPRKRSRLPRARLNAPKGIERQYSTELQKILGALRLVVKQRLLPQLPELVTSRLDSPRADARTIRAVIEDLEVGYAAEFTPRARATARGVAENVNNSSKKQTQQVTQTVLNVRMEQAEPWLTDQLTDFVSRQARLVKRVSTDFFDALESTVERSVRTGQSISQITRDITRDFVSNGGVETDRLRKRARLIARDQVGSYFGDLTQKRQTGLGLKRYTWSTSHDERVRDSHAERDGQIFEWGRPIEHQLEERGLAVDKIDGHPGRPIQCRCVAIPYLEDLLVP